MSFFLWLLWLKWALIMRAPASILVNEWFPHPLLITYKVYPWGFILWNTNHRQKANLLHQSISSLPKESMEQCFCDIHKERRHCWDCSMVSFGGKMIPVTIHPRRSPCDSTDNTPKPTLQLELKSSVKLGGKSPMGWKTHYSESVSTHGHSLFLLQY